MRCRVYRQVCVQRRKKANAPGCEVAFPTGTILEVSENILRIVLIFGIAGEHADDDEIPNDVNHED